MILYFSGTGNSRYAAQRLARALGDELVSLNDCLKRGETGDFTSERPYVFVAPTYSWRMPRVVSDFIRAGRFGGSRAVYFVLTCGGDAGNAGYYAELLCAETGFTYMGLAGVVMPENYLAMFQVPGREEARRMVEEAGPALDALAARIAAGEKFPEQRPGNGDGIKSGVVNRAFYTFCVSAKGFYATEKCIGCGKCVELCPLNNVALAAGRPQWGKRCTHCMACICGCPTEAIEYKNKSKGKERYLLEKVLDRPD